MRAKLSFADGSTGSMESALLEARAPIADLRITGEQGRVHVHFPTRPELAWITTRAGGTTRRERVKGRPTLLVPAGTPSAAQSSVMSPRSRARPTPSPPSA